MTENLSLLGTARVKQLRYVMLSGNAADPHTRGRHDSAYRLWRRSWRETFTELGSEAQLRADDFTRQRIISALYHHDQAIGLLLHSYFNLELEAVREHTYLSTYPPGILAKLRDEGVREVLSMEYLTLDAAWRKPVVGVPLANVILGLGAKVAQTSGLKSMIVVTRNEKRVNEILYGYGARCLARGLTKHNVAVDLVSLDEGKINLGEDPEVHEWIEYFWERREARFTATPFTESA